MLEQLANSLAPSIYGHETIKKGLVSWLHEASTPLRVLCMYSHKTFQDLFRWLLGSGEHFKGWR